MQQQQAKRPPTPSAVLRAGALAIAIGCAAGVAHADDNEGRPGWSFGGFGSIGMVHSSEPHADFTSTVLKASGAGRSRPWSSDVDSRLGAQLGLTLNKQWSGVLQVISELGLDNTYTPIVEWGNIKYQATPELSLRIGRIALPMFLAADYRKVGYAYPWVRTPVEVYGAIPISNSDGVDASYRWRHGGLKNVTQAFYGRTDLKLTESARAKARGLVGFSNTSEYGAVSARLSIFTAELTVDIGRQLFDGFRNFGAHGAALADKYEVDHKRATAFSLGASYDPGRWFVMGEWGRMTARSYLGDKSTVYASAGYRIADFTPYLAFAKATANSGASDPGLALTGMPMPLASAAAGLNAGLNGLLKTIPIQTTVSAGARWDFVPDVSLKLQYDRVLPQGGSSGMLINPDPGFRSGHPLHITSAVLDFVF
jgi:hypothetical protein